MDNSVWEYLGGLMDTDLSAQVMTSLFGTGWERPVSAGGPDTAQLGGLLFDLFGVLNCCCAVVVAWLFILTTLSATLGAAQDGRGIGGSRYSNAWIPLRYSFAMAAVTPVFSGLNAMQMVMLSCVGASVQFADAMWSEGLEYLTGTGVVTARSQPVTAVSAGRVLPVLMEHHALKQYFTEEEQCAFAEVSSTDRAGWSRGRYVIRLELPRLLNCPNLRGDDGYGMTLNPSLHFADMGGARVSTPSRAASEALAKVLAADGEIYREAGEGVRRALAAEDGAAYAAAGVGDLARRYQETVASALREAAAQSAEQREDALASFREQAASQGWWLAGSFYWSLARLAAESVEAMQDRTEALLVNREALADFMNPDLERVLALARELGAMAALPQARPATGSPLKGDMTAEQASLEEEGGLASALTSFFAGASHAVAEFALDDAAIGQGLVQAVAGHDLVFNVVRSARVLMNVCENAVAAYVAVKVVGHGLSAVVKNPVLAAVGGAAEGVLDTAGRVALCVAAPVWLVCWFYAYMLPMLPFLAWVTAVLGWLVLCLEALAACPVWLAAHCMPEGDGFAGASARAGYALFLSVLLRPMLLILSFFLCMVVMSVSGGFMGALLTPFFDVQSGVFAVHEAGVSGWGVTASISTVILVGLVTGVFTWKLFTLITVMPDRVIRWAGQLMAHLGDFGAEQVMHHGRASMDQAAGRLMPAVTAGSAVGLVANMGRGQAAPGRYPKRAAALSRELGMGRRTGGGA